ncbi:hypothetical protein ACQ4LE_006358 [Meloidogyne hapla]|uniref:Uncharacterized protein n=1 Tax=Meloidogyne hapla TaxID=6305 RepID=A0A1I8BL21_MELHA
MMKTPTNNFNKNNIFALAVTILLLLGKVNTTEKEIDTTGEEEMQAEHAERIVGAAKHSLNTETDIVTLVDGSRPATTAEEFKKYKDLFPEACDVELGEGAEKGYIVLSYSKGSKAVQSGCTVDFYTSLQDRIEFAAFVKNAEGCLKEMTEEMTSADFFNANVLPFAYSHPADLERLKKGPITGNSKGCDTEVCIERKCIKRTSLEMRWGRGKDHKQIDSIHIAINPIGSPSFKGADMEMSKFGDNIPEVEIVHKGSNDYSVQFPGKSKDLGDIMKNCTTNPDGNILEPMAWEIAGTRPSQKKKYLLAFHLLPQTASRWIDFERVKVEQGPTAYPGEYRGPPREMIESRMQADSPEGPECDLRILFKTDNYDLLTVNPTTTTTPKSAASKPSSSTTTTTTKATTTTAKPSDSSLVIIIVIVVILLLLSIGGAVAFCVLGKKGGKKKNDDKSVNSTATKSKVKDDKKTNTEI